ncbi:ASCH domain-containing protein [uncultured Microbacterium sp.]|uniref:ASCH domain-containing protein n=1 Tax=uncultured Microbacterium sp. TaxID=191216 RepID=UPI00262351C1|nr:ASCH domain-containing protein [uncultured Microbacterium sp.]
MDTHPTISRFWEQCRGAVEGLPSTVPDAWAFGATPAHADELLALVLDGVKTATASSLWDYEATGEPVPAVDSYSILLESHERYWRAHSENARGFEPDMPVVCEGFRLMYAASSPLA